ncbi:hypothetical protein GCM10011505_46320 [Tistrella bauzanensis]|uniref:DUF1176 domain-containing protein n=1 Tax=Tistrella bauzanensis TaxID=657419 RepID=A0ABQ1J548_9PROT|nr:DUF1176 domain-containing protein [Tistrella bauzanensis]GGB60307.1 hypothetical protein GCM10011505_46320 [Tistrella bauzanensis]
MTRPTTRKPRHHTAARAGVPAALGALMLMAAPAAAQSTGTFKDWWVACDNRHSCTAFGTAPAMSDAVFGTWLSVARDGDGDAVPRLAIGILLADEATTGPVTATLTVPGGGGSLPPIDATIDQGMLMAPLPASMAAAVLPALRQANMLEITVTAPAKGVLAATRVSLAGASAALLYIDDAQKRVGTVTALVRPGDKPASTIPPVPPVPVVTPPQPSTSAVPAGLPAGFDAHPLGDDCDPQAREMVPPLIGRLDAAHVLYGAVCMAGAYNMVYQLWVEDQKGQIATADIEMPDGISPIDLMNVDYDADNRMLSSYAKGRGIGDCGTAASWVWDGRRFRLTSLIAMEVCQGIPADAWPVLYRAEIR